MTALCSPELAALYHFFGLWGLELESAEQQHWLQRIYVRAFEYGLLQRSGGAGADGSILGAALTTSLAELELAGTMGVRRVPFEWEQVVTGPFDTYSPQSTLFVMPSLAWFRSAFGAWAKAEGLYPRKPGSV